MESSASEKNYHIEFFGHSDYLEVRVSAEKDSYELSIKYWEEIAKKLARLKLDKVLVIEDIAGESDLTDIFRLVTELPDLGFRGIKIAFVDKHLSHQEQNDFGIMVGTNRGLHGKAFNDVEIARKWLLDEVT